MAKSKFLYFLISLVALILIYPFVEGGVVGAILLDVFRSAILISGIYAVSHSGRMIILGSVIGVPAMALSIANLFLHDDRLLVFGTILWIIFYLVTLISILHKIIQSRRGRADEIFGAISAYLLMGLMWGMIYVIIEKVYPDSFYFDFHTNADAMISWSDFIFYSFSTLTTLGYGDILPILPFARSFAIIEMIIGMMYIAVIIARLVALYTMKEERRILEEDDERVEELAEEIVKEDKKKTRRKKK